MHVIPDEEESPGINERMESSEFACHKKEADTYTSAYDRVLNVI